MSTCRSSLFTIGFCAVGLVASSCTSSTSTSTTPPAAQTATPAAQTTASRVERGKYLVTLSGCNDCHSPKTMDANGPQPDPARLLSGHPEGIKVTAAPPPPKGSPWTIATTNDLTAWSGPWGVSFAANLTPDPNTGLRSGVWSEEIFIKAIRTGKHMGTSRDILPPMPWPEFSKMTDDDLKAIWEYLGTIPPVTNHVPDPIPPAGTR
jgi:hypothetical protein